MCFSCGHGIECASVKSILKLIIRLFGFTQSKLNWKTHTKFSWNEDLNVFAHIKGWMLMRDGKCNARAWRVTDGRALGQYQLRSSLHVRHRQGDNCYTIKIKITVFRHHFWLPMFDITESCCFVSCRCSFDLWSISTLLPIGFLSFSRLLFRVSLFSCFGILDFCSFWSVGFWYVGL